MAVLNVQELSAAYRDFELHPLSFQMEEGEILTIAGESGSGKTTLAKAVSCLLGEDAQVTGKVWMDGKEILSMSEKERKKLRMSVFSIAFQNSVQWLNPTMTLRGQLGEVLKRQYKPKDQEKRMIELMEGAGLQKEDLSRYPGELSGGMAQKFLLACAVALHPRLVILDEPTSSMDRSSRNEFVSFIRRLNREQGIAFLVITHDLKLAEELSSRMIVLYGGHILEEGETASLLENPRHPYTRGLLQASMGMNLVKDIWGIRPGTELASHHNCPFCARCTQAKQICYEKAPVLATMPDGRRLACHRGGIVKVLEGIGLSRNYGKQQVFRDCSIFVYSGEIVSIVGKSGIGKTTLARILGGFDEGFTRGELLFGGEPADYKKLHKGRHGVQMVFQDSEASLNSRMTVYDAVAEPLFLAGEQKEVIEQCVNQAVADVGLLPGAFLSKKIRELSGGQKQRVSIARALTLEPALLVADEPTAMLDPSSCANLIRLLKTLQNQRGFSMLLVTHDLECALKISDRIFVIREGRLEQIRPSEYIENHLEKIF